MPSLFKLPSFSKTTNHQLMLSTTKHLTHSVRPFSTFTRPQFTWPGFLKNRTHRFYLFVTTFSGAYVYSLYKAKNSDNEVRRIGAAGSLTVLIAESSFYFIDAVNARSKVLKTNVKFPVMLRHILKTDGVAGLFKGYSASFYSSILYGYLYFYIYKGIKVFLKDKL